MKLQEEYDYIIVGAGSSGCVLAHRLSADPQTRVLVLEAGGSDRTPDVWIPAAFSKLFRTARDWNHSTDPEPAMLSRSLYMPSGKMLGGSSSMNAMIYIRGQRADYDGWSSQGCAGWSYDEVLPYFKKSENNERGPSPYHGTGGPLNVADARSPNPLSQCFVDAAVATGIPRNNDFNGERQEGAGLYQLTQRGGRRLSTADAFLRPAMKRGNVHVVIHAMTTRILLEGHAARGVEYMHRNAVHRVRARREVLVAAGAINSPKLLMLSGIGPADHLRSVGISVRVDLPHVGENLQDHPYVVAAWESRQPISLAAAESPRSMAEYVMRRRGLLSSNVGEAGGFVRSHAAAGRADIQFHFAPGYFVDHGFARHDGHAFSVVPTLVTPQSRGRIRIRSADPWAPPSIVGNHLSSAEDMAAMVRGIELAREIVAAAPFAQFRGRELHPGPQVKDRDALIAFIRERAELLYHPACTCRMGAPGHSVVDSALRVHGVSGLRVVDASVMPTIVAGNTNAPCIMIAEKAADLIRRG